MRILEAYDRPANLVDRTQHGHLRKGEGRKRDWKKITGICLHQTACRLGERIERWDSVGAHLGVLRSGRAVHLHEFNREIWHAQAWNAGTIGIEIDGLYAGIQGDQRTVWDDPSTPQREVGQDVTPEAVAMSKDLIRWICSTVARNGGEIRALVAHRQSSSDRRNDPGSQIWQTVALPMHAELGLSDGGVGFSLGGRPIPQEWDPHCKGFRY